MASLSGFSWHALFAGPGTRMRRRPRLTYVPRLEVLEDRCLPSLTAVDHGQLVFDSDAVDLRANGSLGRPGVYWLANANLAATQTFGVTGINPDGSMTWQTALNWVAAMNDVDNGPDQPKGYLGHSNWTLPLTPDVDPDHTATQCNPTTHESFGFDFYSSLFGQLFYTGFGAQAGDNIADLNNAASRLFENFEPYYYWGGDLPGSKRASHLPVDFSFGSGFLGTDLTKDFEYALPEFSIDSCDGPVAPPGNETVFLMPVKANPSLIPVPDHKTVYDAALNITWLADANLAATNTFGVQGINADGSMNYGTAQKWIAALNAADYLGHDNWRLPSSDDSDTQDYYRTDDEMGELYYTELGSQAGSTILLTHDHDEHLFHDFQPYLYWSGSPVVDKDGTPDPNSHKSLSFGNGLRSGNTDPNELYVIPVFDGPQTVTKNLDDGSPGSLRSVIAAAHPGDTIVFAPGLAGDTITLQAPIVIDTPLDIEGPGACALAISGNNANRIFHIRPDASGTTVAGLTLENGQSDTGGAILDDGASLTLCSDVFSLNQAVGGAGGDGLGGALAILAGSTTGMAVEITHCQFSANVALGGAGKADKSGNELSGGSGQGGAVYVDAGASTGLCVNITQSTFENNAAVGGDGVNGDAASGVAATDGGNGQGGALLLRDCSSSVDVDACQFLSNQAIGGAGGTAAAGGAAGSNGQGVGGAIDILPGAPPTGSVWISATTVFVNNHASTAFDDIDGLYTVC